MANSFFFVVKLMVAILLSSPENMQLVQGGCSLDGVLVRLLEVYTPMHPNSHCCALSHHNWRDVVAEIVYDNQS